MSDMKTPTLNVNLVAECLCLSGARSSGHRDSCPAKPVLVLCPIQPTFEAVVSLGECSGCIGDDHPNALHSATCPARPIRVTCSISGNTWKESEVADILEPGITSADMFCACRARWAFVKALVLGIDPSEPHVPVNSAPELLALFARRDAVFAALADMVRHEDGLQEAAQRAANAMGADGDMSGMVRASGEFLEAYVERLIEQVGSL